MATRRSPPPAPRPPSARTAWHPLFVELLRLVLPSRGWQVSPEVPLTREPLRLDVLVVRRLQRAPLPTLLRPEVERFGAFTLVHFVSPSDEPEADDALALLAYGCQFVRLQGSQGRMVQGQVVLFVVCSSLTPRYVAALERLEGRLARVERGPWQGVVAGFRLEVVETSQRSETPGEALWRTVSKAFLTDPTGGLVLDAQELEICRQLQRHVQRYEAQGDEPMASEAAKIVLSLQEVTRRIVQDAPVEVRLAGLAPEQRLAGLAPEQVAAGLTAEQRAELLALLSASTPVKAPRSSARRARPGR